MMRRETPLEKPIEKELHGKIGPFGVDDTVRTMSLCHCISFQSQETEGRFWFSSVIFGPFWWWMSF